MSTTTWSDVASGGFTMKERDGHQPLEMTMPNAGHGPYQPVSRISMSLPGELLIELDRMVDDRGYASRSQAISDMLHQFLVEHRREVGNDVMVGTITLLYDNSVPGLQKQLADLQYRHIDEVISSLHVSVKGNQTLEVILVQGPAQKLQAIADKMITQRGVTSGRIQVVAALIPQVHPFIAND
jgi:CopG family nickel-responsive transcriptional regulator